MVEQKERVQNAEHEVRICLNYGAVFFDGSHPVKELKWDYVQGDIKNEVHHMRRLAQALNELADALEAEENKG